MSSYSLILGVAIDFVVAVVVVDFDFFAVVVLESSFDNKTLSAVAPLVVINRGEIEEDSCTEVEIDGGGLEGIFLVSVFSFFVD